VEIHEQQASQTVHEVFTHLLKPLFDTRCQTGCKIICANGNVDLCFPKLFCWVANYMENAIIHTIASNHCPVCIVLLKKLGEYSETGYPRHSHTNYTLAHRESNVLSLNKQEVRNINNAL